MRITIDAMAGTLESCDVLVRVAPSETLEIDITSTVWAQFGDAIEAVVDEELARLGVTGGRIILDDKGALDCTLRARLESAVLRGAGASPDWAQLQGGEA